MEQDYTVWGPGFWGKTIKSRKRKKKIMKNVIHLIGRIGKQPEILNLESGNTIAKFSLATSETWKDKTGEKKEETQWHNIILWNNQAKVAEMYLNKGDLVAIDGKIMYRKFDDKDGNTRYVTEIKGNTLTMLGGNKKEVAPPSTTPENASIGEGVEPDDLPF